MEIFSIVVCLVFTILIWKKRSICTYPNKLYTKNIKSKEQEVKSFMDFIKEQELTEQWQEWQSHQ